MQWFHIRWPIPLPALPTPFLSLSSICPFSICLFFQLGCIRSVNPSHCHSFVRRSFGSVRLSSPFLPFLAAFSQTKQCDLHVLPREQNVLDERSILVDHQCTSHEFPSKNTSVRFHSHFPIAIHSIAPFSDPLPAQCRSLVRQIFPLRQLPCLGGQRQSGADLAGDQVGECNNGQSTDRNIPVPPKCTSTRTSTFCRKLLAFLPSPGVRTVATWR